MPLHVADRPVGDLPVRDAGAYVEMLQDTGKPAAQDDRDSGFGRQAGPDEVPDL